MSIRVDVDSALLRWTGLSSLQIEAASLGQLIDELVVATDLHSSHFGPRGNVGVMLGRSLLRRRGARVPSGSVVRLLARM